MLYALRDREVPLILATVDGGKLSTVQINGGYVMQKILGGEKAAGSKSVRIVAIVLVLVVTSFIFLFWRWDLLGSAGNLQCLCGGCCLGCPGDCELNVGFPVIYYASGFNEFEGNVRLFSFSGLIVDVAVWAILLFLIYRFIYKRRAKGSQ
jgi:hypothetical protein